MRKLNLPLTKEEIASLHVGDSLLISGTVFTARDAAHKKMLEDGIPFDIVNQTIYYVGPTQTPKNAVVGSAGPTTATRMDKYTPALYDQGMQMCIGKGKRSAEVHQAIIRNHGLYLITVGGAGAYLSKCVISSQLVAYPELQSEAIRKWEVKDFPVFVGIDSYGEDIYENNR